LGEVHNKFGFCQSNPYDNESVNNDVY